MQHGPGLRCGTAESTEQLARERPAYEESEPFTATCLYLVYDPVERTCVVAAAGHPEPMVAFPDGRTAVLTTPQGPVLGSGVPSYLSREVSLPEGSVLTLRSASLAGDDAEREMRVYRTVLSTPGTLWDACDALASQLMPTEPVDDAMLLLARTRAFGPHQVASWSLPGIPESAAEARRLVHDWLAQWNLGETAFTTGLIASELVTNAVRYADGNLKLRLICQDALICEVTDTSSATPRLRRAEDDDEGGRGLYLVAQCCQRWGTRPSGHGKTIWTEQQLP